MAAYAVCTLLTDDGYLPGALTLAAALHDLHPRPAAAPEVDFKTVCLVTPETVDVGSIKLLRRAFDVVVGVEIIDPLDDKNLHLLGRLDLNQVLTKLHVFRLSQYSKVLFLDADVLPIRPLSHLFTLPFEFSAVPDVGWPDIFNSGVMVLTPSEASFNELMSLKNTIGSWDGGDQGLLNEWRGGNWNRLSFTYNTTPTAAYTYAPAYERYGSKITAIHFIGPNKPWKGIPWRAPGSESFRRQLEETQPAYDYSSLVDRWFAVYDRHYRLSGPSSGSSGFEVPRYQAAWDEGTNVGAEVLPSATTPSGAVTASTHGIYPGPGGVSVVAQVGALGLDDLRRAAVDGADTVYATTDGGAGEYVKMPLEGRVDLMRPKREVFAQADNMPHVNQGFDPYGNPPSGYPYTDTSDSEFFQTRPIGAYHGQGGSAAAVSRFLQLPRRHSRTTSTPSLAPTEPPGRRPHFKTLPSSHSSTAVPFLNQENRPQRGRHSPPSHSPPLTRRHSHVHVQPPHHNVHKHVEHHHGHPHADRHQAQIRVDHHQDHAHAEHHEQHKPSAVRRHSEDHHHHLQLLHLHNNHHAPHEHVSAHPPSPPIVHWNPAVDPPPNDPPTSDFPANTYFPNAWDEPQGHRHDSPEQRHSPIRSMKVELPAFFHEPPPPVIPKVLIQQGQYQNVTGPVQQEQTNQPATPHPDPSKVTPVFPWEQQPRPAPKRVFPKDDTPLSPSEPVAGPKPPTPPPPAPPPKPPAPPSRRQSISSHPPPGKPPGSLGYANAWDVVPSIQKYASRLVRPEDRPHMARKPIPTFDDAAYLLERDWEAQAEIESQDADDEDDSDDEDYPRSRKSPKISEDFDVDFVQEGTQTPRQDGSRPNSRRPTISGRTRSTNGTASPTQSFLVSRNKKEYRDVGVQTLATESQSKGIQVSSATQITSPASLTSTTPRPAPPTTPSTIRRPSSRTQSMSATRPVLNELRRDSFSRNVGLGIGPLGVEGGRGRVESLPTRRGSAPLSLADSGGLGPPAFVRPDPRRARRTSSPMTPPSATQGYTAGGSPSGLSSQTVSPAGSTPRAGVGLGRPRLAALGTIERSVSGTSVDTALSPPDSVAPATPFDTMQPFGSSGTNARKSGRVFDPNTGVDVIKRGSEQVLARFLRLNTWEDEETTPSHTPP